MSSSKSRLLAIVVVIGGGVFSPAPSFSDGYRFFASFYDESRATVYSMDTSGTLQEGQSYTVGYDPEKVAASPNGQLVVVSSGSHPQLSAFFINPEGTIDPPRTCDPLESKGFDPPFCFHPWKDIAFSRFFLTDTVFEIDYSTKRLEATSCTLTLDDGGAFSLGYSAWSDHLYYRDTGTPYGDPIGVRGVGLSDEECFTTVTRVLEIPRSSMNSDFTVSPDGRWGVAIGITNPMMSIIEIHRNGSLEMHQQFSYDFYTEVSNPEAVRFTPDGRYLIMLDWGPHDLISYRLNPATSLWEEVDHTTGPHDPPWTAPQAMAISPDGKFIVVQEVEPSGPATTLRVVRLGDDGTLTILPDKYLEVDGFPSALEFIPPWSESYPDAPNGVMMH